MEIFHYFQYFERFRSMKKWQILKPKIVDWYLHFSNESYTTLKSVIYAYAAAKNYKTKSREDILYKEISSLEKELDENTALSDTQKSLLQSKLDNLRSEMEVIIEYRTRGAILRSRTRWHNEGEKNTKYFLNLEKRHYRQGTISRLKKSENDFATIHR